MKWLLLVLALVAIAALWSPSVTISRPVVGVGCHCLVKMEDHVITDMADPNLKDDEDARCQDFKAWFVNYFGGLPYDPCPHPTPTPVDGMGRPIP